MAEATVLRLTVLGKPGRLPRGGGICPELERWQAR